MQLSHSTSKSIILIGKKNLKINLFSFLKKINILITSGMRGAGKSYMGSNLSKSLGRECIDLDNYFEKVKQQTIMEFVKENNWPKFREEETKILMNVKIKILFFVFIFIFILSKSNLSSFFQ